LATQHPLDHTNVEAVVQAGRARWKIENENNNTRKTSLISALACGPQTKGL
jgi:hypothetical protein